MLDTIKAETVDVGIKPKLNDLDFKLESMSEEATLRFEKMLGNGHDVLILGYVAVPKLVSVPVSPSLDKVRLYAERTFGKGCKVYPINPHDSLPEHIRVKTKYFKDKINAHYCLIYLPPEKQ
jgi:hypothetical protein